MRDSSMACSFLASSYSEFSAISPNSRAVLMRSATSRRRIVDRCSSSSLSLSRPSGVRMTSLGMNSREIRGVWAHVPVTKNPHVPSAGCALSEPRERRRIARPDTLSGTRSRRRSGGVLRPARRPAREARAGSRGPLTVSCCRAAAVTGRIERPQVPRVHLRSTPAPGPVLVIASIICRAAEDLSRVGGSAVPSSRRTAGCPGRGRASRRRAGVVHHRLIPAASFIPLRGSPARRACTTSAASA